MAVPPEYYMRLYVPINFLATSLANRIVFEETEYFSDLINKYPVIKLIIIYTMAYTYILNHYTATFITFIFFLYTQYKKETTKCEVID